MVGYHLCYGTFPEWPTYEAADLGVLVRMATMPLKPSGHTVDWLHLAGLRYLRSEDDRFSAPLVDLNPKDARVFLGIVLPLDGGSGLKRRHRMASKYLTTSAVAMYCGFGRQPGERTACRRCANIAVWAQAARVYTANRRRLSAGAGSACADAP